MPVLAPVMIRTGFSSGMAMRLRCGRVAPVDPTAARFPAAPARAGHYESFYLKLCHPSEPLGAWIRYTVHKRPGAAPTGSLWFTLFEAGGPRAAKLTLPEPVTGDADWLRVGEARIGGHGASGAIGEEVAWELAVDDAEEPLFHLPAAWLYRAPLPRTKLLSPAPAARFSGRLSVDGRSIEVDGWRGMVGHNWGAQHAERWIWLHGITADGDWLDAAIARVKVGSLTTPWVANGALSIAGDRYALRRARVTEYPTSCTFELSGRGVRVRGTVEAPRERFVGWVYADPDGSEHHALNCSIADMRLRVSRGSGAAAELVVSAGAAYELGMRERDHGVPVQAYPDG
jgi:hypothetical protein